MEKKLLFYLNYHEQDEKKALDIWLHLKFLLEHISSASLHFLKPGAWSSVNNSDESFLLNFWSQGGMTDGYILNQLDTFFALTKPKHPRDVILNLIIEPDLNVKIKNSGLFDGARFFDVLNVVSGGETSSDGAIKSNAENSQLVDCAYYIQRSLQNLDLQADENKLYKIFLADTGSHLSEQRESIRLELQRLGVQVIYSVAPNNGDPDKVIRQLSESDFSIHLISADYGEILPGQTVSTPEIQLENALKIEKPSFKIFIWVPPDLQFQDIRQKNFFETIKRESDHFHQVEMLISSLEYFKMLLGEWLLQPSVSLAEEGGAHTKSSIYLIYDQVDADGVQVIRRELAKTDFRIREPLFDLSPTERINAHYKSINECQIAVIYADQATDNWIKMKMMDLIKSPGMGRNTPIKQKILFSTGKLNDVAFWADFEIVEDFRSDLAPEVINKLINT